MIRLVILGVILLGVRAPGIADLVSAVDLTVYGSFQIGDGKPEYWGGQLTAPGEVGRLVEVHRDCADYRAISAASLVANADNLGFGADTDICAFQGSGEGISRFQKILMVRFPS